MLVVSTIKVYSVDGNDEATDKLGNDTISVSSASRHAGAIDLCVAGRTYTVTGMDLRRAIDNALNVPA